MGEPLSLAYVEWLDIHTRDGWSDLSDEDLEPARCTSVGILVANTDDFVRFTPCISTTQSLVILAIPKGCIKRLEILTLETLLKQFE